MIRNFTVKNFYSIKNQITLSFEPTSYKSLSKYYVQEFDDQKKVLKSALIFGPNASGKTNILKAIDFLVNLSRFTPANKDEKIPFYPFLPTKDDTTFFEIEFYADGIRFLYSVELNQNAIINETLYFYPSRKAKVFERTTDLNKKVSEITFGSKIKIKNEDVNILKSNILWNTTVLAAYNRANVFIAELDKVSSWFKNKIISFIQPDTFIDLYTANLVEQKKIEKQTVIELLQKADFSITDFEIKKEKTILDEKTLHLLEAITDFSGQNIDINKLEQVKNIYFVHKTKDGIQYKIPFEGESDGTRRYFGFIGLLLDVLINDKILLIDELEASLHPDLVEHFYLTFLVNSNKAQLIATSHFREFLMEKDILRPDIIWFTETKDDNSTDLFSLADFDTSVIRKVNSYYNFYKIGKLGAVPYLGDYFLNLKNNE